MDDKKKLKMFLNQYFKTKAIYQEMAEKIGLAELEVNIESKSIFYAAYMVKWFFRGIVLGLIAGIGFFGFCYEVLGVESNAIAWLTILIIIVVPIFVLCIGIKIKNKSINKILAKIEKIHKEYTIK